MRTVYASEESVDGVHGFDSDCGHPPLSDGLVLPGLGRPRLEAPNRRLIGFNCTLSVGGCLTECFDDLVSSTQAPTSP